MYNSDTKAKFCRACGQTLIFDDEAIKLVIACPLNLKGPNKDFHDRVILGDRTFNYDGRTGRKL